MSLVTTPGAANANSFATVDEFKTYRDSRLPSNSTVTAASDASIEAALIATARNLGDFFTWTGAAVDDVQALTWPRSGMLTRNNFAIPTSGATSIQPPLKDAQCEWAFQLLAGGDFASDDDAAKAGIAEVKAGSVDVKFQNVVTSTTEAVDLAMRKQTSEFNYLNAPGEVRRLLVPSWFEQPTAMRPLFFQAFGGVDR